MDFLQEKRFARDLGEVDKLVQQRVAKCRSALFTYQGRWGDLFDVAPDDNLSVDALCALLKNHPQARESFQEVLQNVRRLCEEKHVQHYVVSQELCKDSWIKQKKVRIHIHVWVLKPQTINTLSIDDLFFKNESPRPHVSEKEIGGGRGTRSACQSQPRSNSGVVSRF